MDVSRHPLRHVIYKKRGHRLMTIGLILSNLNRLKIFFTERFLRKFAVNCILKIPPYFAYVATMTRETLMSAKEVIDDKLQGSVGTYSRCGGVAIITKLRRVYCWVCEWNFFLNRQSYKQERGCLMHFSPLPDALLKDDPVLCLVSGSPAIAERPRDATLLVSWKLKLYIVRDSI